MGVSLNGGTPNLHPEMIIFSRKTHGSWPNQFLQAVVPNGQAQWQGVIQGEINRNSKPAI